MSESLMITVMLNKLGRPASCNGINVYFAKEMSSTILSTVSTFLHLTIRRFSWGGQDAIARDPNAVTVSEITRLYITKRYGDDDLTSVRRALRVAALPESWKTYFRERLQKMNV